MTGWGAASGGPVTGGPVTPDVDTAWEPSPLAPTPTPRRRVDWALLGAFVAGAAVAVGLGVYGRLHEPTGIAVSLAGFSGPLAAKAWLATAAMPFALLQVTSALVMYGRLPLAAGSRWWAPAHRWSGRIAFLVTVPVAVHCLYAVGFQTFDTRVLVHSLLGCAFYGAFTTKMLSLTRARTPGWLLPVLGGGLFTALVGLWLTSSLWFFTTFGVTT